MQRVVRSTLAVLTLASLAACGDKVTIPPQQVISQTPVTPVVHGVTVSPTQASMNVGDKITIGASVNADAGLDRTVTWSSSDATIASVDANGLVTALKAGTASIKATSKADATQSASAVITVGGGTNGAAAVVSISSINQTQCGTIAGSSCASVPANLANVVGQIDVTLNVDPGAQRLLGVDLVLNCTGAGNSGKDTVVASQTLASANVAPAADAAAAPVTLSFNTASFNSTTGATLFKNGACTVKAVARTNSSAGGAVTTTTSTGLSLTLANPDVIIGSVTAGTTKNSPLTGLAWSGKSVTINTIPVFFSNRTAAQTVVTFEGRNIRLGAGAQTVTFVDRNDPSIGAVSGAGIVAGAGMTTDSLDIDGITDPAANAGLAVNIIDSNGQNFANPGAGVAIASVSSYLTNPNNPASVFASPLRLDTKKPASGTLNIASNVEQGTGPGAFLNGSFRFAGDSAAGYRGADTQGVGGNVGATCGGVAYTPTRTSNCDFGGVDSVTVVFEVGSAATATTWTRVTNPSSLPETATNTSNTLRQITTDLLGNADTTFVCSVAQAAANPASANGAAGQCTEFSSGTRSGGERFGVDKTAPTQSFTAGVTDRSVFQSAAAPGNYFVTISDGGTAGASGIGTYAGAGTVLVAQTRQTGRTYTGAAIAGFENNVYSDIATAARPGSADVIIVTPAGVVNSDNTPCTIGRFNASQSNAGANALPVLSASGATLGFCTPVPYQPTNTGPAGTSGIPAGNAIGYVRTEVIPSDMAGNVGTTFTATIYVDNAAPVVQNVDMPGQIAGGSTVAFPVSATDTGAVSNSVNSAGDIVSSVAFVCYDATGGNNVTGTGPCGANTIALQYPADNSVGVAFDNVLTRTATANPSVTNFLKTLFVSTGGNTQPNATATPNADSVAFTVFDAANLASTAQRRAISTAANSNTQITGTNTVYQSGTVTRTFTGGFVASENNTVVQNCAAAGCNAGTATTTNTSTTITATASGATGTFTNPFTTVQVWYRQQGTTDPFVMAGTASVVGTQDNGTTRTWQYSFTFDPPTTLPANLNAPAGRDLTVGGTQLDYFVVGVNSNGDGVATPIRTITIANP